MASDTPLMYGSTMLLHCGILVLGALAARVNQFPINLCRAVVTWKTMTELSS